MRLGLLADIHEQVGLLRLAIRELTARKVDSFVMLGDVLDHGEHMDETVALLEALPGYGVWGNHDFGLCGDITPYARSAFSAPSLEYFAALVAQVEVGGCRFQHIDPHLNPAVFEDLWQNTTPSERIEDSGGAPSPACSSGTIITGGFSPPSANMIGEARDHFGTEPTTAI